MRSVAAVLAGLAVAALAAGIVWRLTSSRPPQLVRPRVGGAGQSSDLPEPPQLPVPLTPKEEERREYERARKPFMTALQSFASTMPCTVSMGEDLSELTVAASGVRDEMIQAVRHEAIRLGAEKQGFRTIRFYERSPEGSGLPPRLVAEVVLHEGRWTTFFR